MFLHPTTQFCCTGRMWWLTVRPVAADRTVLSIGGCFRARRLNKPTFEADAAPYYKRWGKRRTRGCRRAEKLQGALHSRLLFQLGPLSWRDDLVHTFDRWVMDRLPEGRAKALNPERF